MIAEIPTNAAVLVPLSDLTGILQAMIRQEVRAKNNDELQERLLSPEETCKLFTPAISLPTLNSYAEKGYLTKYSLGGRTWYKYGEVMSSLKTFKKYSRENHGG